MRYKVFLTGVFQFPFHIKRLVSLIWICSLVVSLAVFASADENVRQSESDDTRQLIKQAEKLTRKGKMAEAEKILRRVIKIAPQESKAKLILAYLLLKQRQLIEAFNFAFEVAKAEPKNSFAFAVLGAILLSAGSFNEAKLSFVNALQLDKKEALAWAGLGTLDFYENRISSGLDKLQTAVYFEPNDPDFMFTLAQVSARAEKYNAAAAAYEKFLQISPQTDAERRDRIKGLINFLRYLDVKQSLYNLSGENQTVVSFVLSNNRPIIQVKINNKDEPLNFVLDTGSGISVISRETAKNLKIKPITKGGLANAIGGAGKFEIVYGFLKSVNIGEVKITNVPVYIREFHSKNEKIDGYIGLALISKFLTTIDYGNSTFALKKKDLADGQKAGGELLSLPLRLTSSGFLSGEVQLEGIESPLNFIIDTGASVSVISDELANTKEINRFIRDEKMRVIGAAGVIENVSLSLLPRVTFGTHSRESITAIALDLDVINETSGFTQAGILGGNFLKNYRLTFDFANSKVVFVPIVQ
ncbi:MAG: aspartyl protease family protein [Acidobacteria bacterium]|nr:aspartyl protease family protein [Acidobacteriota bacterium]